VLLPKTGRHSFKLRLTGVNTKYKRSGTALP
jgi:hypothetical protein